MKGLLILSVIMLLATTGIIAWGLIRGWVRGKMIRTRQRDALSHAYLGLHQIQAYSEDPYAKNLAASTLGEIASILGTSRELNLKEI